MATGYIVWDKDNLRMVAGPYASDPTNADLLRILKQQGDQRKSLAQFSVETVTCNRLS